jgi:hypothetical protein
MGDEERVPEIDLKEVDNWLVSRNADRMCPICGQGDWIPPTRPLAILMLTEDR